MKYLSFIILAILSTTIYAQDKDVPSNQFTKVEGTKYIIATFKEHGLKATYNGYMIFIDTTNGRRKKIDFPKFAYYEKFEQIKIDSLGINKILLLARMVNLNKSRIIDEKDPMQIILVSPDGEDKTQLTEDNFFAKAWIIDKQAGTIIIKGRFDSNNNSKQDKADKSETLTYDLKTLKLVSKT